MSSIPGRIAVTGAAGYIGRRLIARLAEEPAVLEIVALDRQEMLPRSPKVRCVQQDLTGPLDPVVLDVDAVVHLAFTLRQSRDRRTAHRNNVGSAANLLQACRARGVQRIIYLSSSTVYGPHADNPPLLAETAPLRPPRAFQYAWDKAESERLFQDYITHMAGARASILRACVVMGAEADNFITQAFFKPLLIGVKGHDPLMQFVHEDDLIELLLLFLSGEHPGVFNVAAPGVVSYAEVARMAGKRVIWLPAPLAYGLTGLAWELRIQQDSPAAGLDFIRYPWLVSTDRLMREVGYQFAYTSEDALWAYLSS